MVRRSFRWGLWLGLLVGVAWALRRTLMLRRSAATVEVSRDPWTPIATIDAEPLTVAPPAPPAPKPAAVAVPAAQPPAVATITERAATGARTWVLADDGRCPPGYPLKAKVASRVFRAPGMPGYEQSRPDRCYPTEEAAVADGFTKAKR